MKYTVIEFRIYQTNLILFPQSHFHIVPFILSLLLHLEKMWQELRQSGKLLSAIDLTFLPGSPVIASYHHHCHLFVCHIIILLKLLSAIDLTILPSHVSIKHCCYYCVKHFWKTKIPNNNIVYVSPRWNFHFSLPSGILPNNWILWGNQHGNGIRGHKHK